MCDCIEQVNEQIGKRGSRLFLPISFNSDMTQNTDRVSIRTVKISGRGKGINLQAAFCPFCGKHYD